MKICSADGCPNTSYARGLCRKHYTRLLRHGDITVVKRPGIKRDPVPWLDERDSERRSFAADDPRHGTPYGYNNLRCRCQKCRTANTKHLYELRRIRKERDGG